MADKANLETWKNVGKGRVVVQKFDRLTGRMGDELVAGGRSFTITPDDRRVNQDAVANSDMDIFSNGTLVSVRLIDSEEDAAAIASNPNLLSDTDIKALFEGHWKTFERRVGEIRNLTTLERLREVGEERDATVKQMAVIEARIAELTPSVATSYDRNATPDGPQFASVGDAATFRPVSPG